MVIQECDIKFSIISDGEEYLIETYRGEYRNLMVLIMDKIYVEDFGECKGMGRCGTCVVEVLESQNNVPEIVRNEEATLKKTGVVNSNARLSCQILVEDEIKNAVIRIC